MRAILEDSLILRQLVKRDSAEEIELRNGITIAVRTASFRRLRGYTAVAVIFDEVAYWFNEERSANPDTEILAAVRPMLLTTRGPLIAISSPYAKRGVLWDAFSRYFGPDGPEDVLVAQGASWDLNPTLSRKDIDREYEKDSARASAEYGGIFRTDLESFVSLEALEQCSDPDFERPPYSREFSYTAFVDPSGGSSDSFTLAIAHMEENIAVLDCVREVPAPFMPSEAVEEFVDVLKQYRISSVTGDKYAGEWPTEQFSRFGIL